VQVAAGNTHGLALRSDGTVWAWGQGTHGELGDGTLNSSTTPVQVYGTHRGCRSGGRDKDSLALHSDGTVWAWGENQFGQRVLTDAKCPGYRFTFARRPDQAEAKWSVVVVVEAAGDDDDRVVLDVVDEPVFLGDPP
jgi:alpha-tubulin suppressor-like RCC1 family protein